MQCFAAGNQRFRHRAAFTDMKRPSTLPRLFQGAAVGTVGGVRRGIRIIWAERPEAIGAFNPSFPASTGRYRGLKDAG